MTRKGGKRGMFTALETGRRRLGQSLLFHGGEGDRVLDESDFKFRNDSGGGGVSVVKT